MLARRSGSTVGAVTETSDWDTYGYRDYSARDIEGGLWSFMQPLD